MSQLQKEIQGIVNWITMPTKMNVNTKTPNVGFETAVRAFSQSSKVFFRIQGLSSREHFKRQNNDDRIPSLCTAAVMEAVRFLFDNIKHLRGVDFAMMDGTPIHDMKVSPEFERCVNGINVHFRNDRVIIVVDLETNRIHRTHYAWYETQIGQSVFFIYEFQFDQLEQWHKDGIVESVGPISEHVYATDQYLTVARHFDFICHTTLAPIYSAVTEYPTTAAVTDGTTLWFVERPYTHHHILNSREFIPQGEVCHGYLTNHGNFINRYRAAYLASKHKMFKISEDFKLAMDIISSTQKSLSKMAKEYRGITVFDGRDTALRFMPVSDDDYLISQSPLLTDDIW